MRPRIHVLLWTAALAVVVTSSWADPALAAPPPPVITSPATTPTVTNQPPSITWDARDQGGVSSVEVERRDATCAHLLFTTTLFGNDPNAGTYTEQPTLADGTYCYDVLVEYMTPDSPQFSNSVVITYDTTPPGAPGTPVAGATYTAGAPSLVWPASAAPDLRGYDVFRNGQLVAGPLAGTSFVDTSAPDGAYTYAVDAVDAAGNHSALSPPVTIVRDTGPPTPPRGLVATVNGSAIDLTWGGASDSLSPVVAYVVRRSAAGGPAPPSATAGTAVCSTTGAQSCSDPSPAAGSTFTYSVFAVDAAGNVSSAATSPAVSVAGGVVLATVPDRTPPPRPRRATARVHGTTVRLSWSDPKVHDFDHVLVLANATRRPRSRQDGIRKYAGAGTSVTVTVAPGTEQHFAVFAYDHAGNVSPAAFVDVRMPAVGPLSPPAGAVLSGAARLSWQPVARAVYYNVQLYRGHTRVATAWPRAARWAVPAGMLKKGQTYTWYVWPGVGPKVAGRYGSLIGKATFTYAGAG
jgi:hypothetical protein